MQQTNSEKSTTTDLYTLIAKRTGTTRQYVKTKLFMMMYLRTQPTLESMVEYILLCKQFDPEVADV